MFCFVFVFLNAVVHFQAVMVERGRNCHCLSGFCFWHAQGDEGLERPLPPDADECSRRFAMSVFECAGFLYVCMNRPSAL